MSESDEQHEPPRPHESAGDRRSLSSDQAAELAEQLAQLTAMGAPLADGLRAAAEETTDRRLERVFTTMAARVEAGESLESVLAQRAASLPPHVTGLVQAGVRCGQLSQVLGELVERHRMVRELRRGVWLATAYPLFLLIAVAVMFVFFCVLVIPTFLGMYSDFHAELPPMTQVIFVMWKYMESALIWFGRIWAGLTSLAGLITLGTIAVILLVARIWLGRRPGFERVRAGWHWFLSTMPVVGPLRTAIFVADFARLLRVLLEQQVPLPDALKLTAAGLGDAHIAATSRELAYATAAGRSLSSALQATSRLPALLVPLIAWGERTGRLPDALATISEMFEGRVRLGTSMLTSILPPLVFIIVGGTILGLMVSLGIPMVGITSRLS